MSRDRIIPVYRPAVEVFDIRSLASFEGKPVTNEHPEEDVTPDNYQKYSCGHVQNVHAGAGEDSNKVLADLYITDPILIKLIENGKREVSCGYYAEEKKDSSGKICQTRIRGNHVAVVENGRAGKTVCIRDKKPTFNWREDWLKMKSHRDEMGLTDDDFEDRYIEDLEDSHIEDRYIEDFGVKGMKKGVRHEKPSSPRTQSPAKKTESSGFRNYLKKKEKEWSNTGNSTAGRMLEAISPTAFRRAQNRRLAGTALHFINKGIDKVAGKKDSAFAKIGNAIFHDCVPRRTKKSVSVRIGDSLYRDYGVKGMKWGEHVKQTVENGVNSFKENRPQKPMSTAKKVALAATLPGKALINPAGASKDILNNTLGEKNLKAIGKGIGTASKSISNQAIHPIKSTVGKSVNAHIERAAEKEGGKAKYFGKKALHTAEGAGKAAYRLKYGLKGAAAAAGVGSLATLGHGLHQVGKITKIPTQAVVNPGKFARNVKSFAKDPKAQLNKTKQGFKHTGQLAKATAKGTKYAFSPWEAAKDLKNHLSE